MAWWGIDVENDARKSAEERAQKENLALRERQEDIRMLVEYIVDRYARKAGKRMKGINKKTLTFLQTYPWLGNIREPQNVIERSFILCETVQKRINASLI